MRPESMAVLGLGAMGGSIAWQARRAGVARVIGYSPVPAHAVRALKAGAISEMEATPARAIRGVDLVVLAGRPSASAWLVRELRSRLPAAALMTDTASIMAPGARAAVAEGLADRFAGSHPLASPRRGARAGAGAGAEFEFEGATPGLYRGSVVYVCPAHPKTGERAAREIAHFWSDVMEAEPVVLDPAEHDEHVAWTRHLPHAVAVALAATLADRRLGGVTFSEAARSTAGLAGGDPDEWAELLSLNAKPVLEALANMDGSLATLRELLERGDPKRLREYLKAAAAFRRGIER